jgi:hypothetical protein
VQVNRTNLYINYEEPNLLADELAALTSAVLYPMEIYLDSSGEYTKIHNFSEIRKRWEAAKPGITKIYKGEYADQYIANFEFFLSDPDLLDKHIKKDWFLKAYFAGLYRTYPPEGTSEAIQASFPVLPFVHPVEYTLQYSISALEEGNEKLFQINREGKVTDQRTVGDFINESDFPLSLLEEEPGEKAEGHYRALYFLEPAYHTIQSLYLECTLELEKTKKVYIAASRTDQPKKSKIIREEGIIEIVKSNKPKSKFLFD